MMSKLFAIVLLASSLAFAQQPQTQIAPIFATNSQWTNGVSPGYAPTAGSGLTLNIGAGTTICNNTLVEYAGGTLSLTASATNYVYLNEGSSCAPAASTSAWSSGQWPLFKVTTSGSAITGIDDVRTYFNYVPSGAGTVTNFTAGTLSPLFTTSVATSTTTPALTFVLTNAGGNTIFGNWSGTSGPPSYNSMLSGGSCGDATHAVGWTAGTGFVCQNVTGSGTTYSPSNPISLTGTTFGLKIGAGLVLDVSGNLTSRPQITSSFIGTPANGQIIIFIPVAVNTTIPSSCTGSLMGALTAATNSTTFTLYYLAGGPTGSPTSFGTAVFSSSGNTAAFTCASSHAFTAGDYLEVKGPPTADSTLATIGLNLLGSAQ